MLFCNVYAAVEHRHQAVFIYKMGKHRLKWETHNDFCQPPVRKQSFLTLKSGKTCAKNLC